MSDTQTEGDPLASVPVAGTIGVMSKADQVEYMISTGSLKITPKGQNNWPGNYKALNDRQVMNLVKMVQDGKARRPETIRAILTEAQDRGLITV